VLRSDEESGATRDRAAELNAVPGLVDIMYDFLEAHDAAHAKQKRARDDESDEKDENDETAPADDDDETANATAAAAATASALEPCVANALRCLIDLTRTVATRLRVVNAGGIGPACRLMDADVFAEALAERAAVLLINCCVAGPADRDDPFSSAAKARVAVAQTGGVGKIVNGLRRSPRDPAGCRAVHLLSLVADDPATRAAFRENGEAEAEAAFKALAPFLVSDSDSDSVPVSVKHAAVAANGL
jgi:hypothetical protein